MCRACRRDIIGWIIALLVTIALGSCDYAPYQELMQTQTLPKSRWYADHTITFTTFVTNAQTPHTLYLYVRHNNRYKYTTLPMTIELRSHLGWCAQTKLSLPLAKRPSIWDGEGYALQQISYTVTPTLTPPLSGIYTIQLRQASDELNLSGIETIGVAWVSDTN